MNEAGIIQIAIWAVVGYLLGSIPFGLVLTRLAGYGDIRKLGSGNIGATNVLRTGNKLLAVWTLYLDGFKGAAAVLLAWLLDGREGMMAAGLFSVLGHVYPVWLKFKGGKGVATALGMLLALAPYAGALSCGVWLAAAFIFRYSSAAALLALLCAPIVTFAFYNDMILTEVCMGVSLLVWYRHKDNIERLLGGTEPKIGSNKKNHAAKPAVAPEAAPVPDVGAAAAASSFPPVPMQQVSEKKPEKQAGSEEAQKTVKPAAKNKGAGKK